MTDTNNMSVLNARKINGDFAKVTTFENEKLALSWTMLHGPTRQLTVHMHVHTPLGLASAQRTVEGPTSVQCSSTTKATVWFTSIIHMSNWLCRQVYTAWAVARMTHQLVHA